jgi:hypothetical protein
MVLVRGKGGDRWLPGWPYSLLVGIQWGSSSWVDPIEARRLRPGEPARQRRPRVHVLHRHRRHLRRVNLLHPAFGSRRAFLGQHRLLLIGAPVQRARGR